MNWLLESIYFTTAMLHFAVGIFLYVMFFWKGGEGEVLMFGWLCWVAGTLFMHLWNHERKII